MRLTIDTNCIIDVEEERANATFVREIVSLHGQRGVCVAVSAIGASERQRSGGYAQSFTEFQTKLKSIGFEALELLLPIAYADICFWDQCLLADENDPLERQIHEVLFPSIEFVWRDYARARGLEINSVDKTWRNAKCDVLSMWCHIKHGAHVFVTNDRNFHAVTKKSRLIGLGAGLVADPQAALAEVRRSLRSLDGAENSSRR